MTTASWDENCHFRSSRDTKLQARGSIVQTTCWLGSGLHSSRKLARRPRKQSMRPHDVSQPSWSHSQQVQGAAKAAAQVPRAAMQQHSTHAHLLIPVHEVHEPVVVVVVVGALGRIGGDHQIVGPQPVPLRVCIAEDAGLQQLVVAVPNACKSRQRGGAVSPVPHVSQATEKPSTAVHCLSLADLCSPPDRLVRRTELPAEAAAAGPVCRCLCGHDRLGLGDRPPRLRAAEVTPVTLEKPTCCMPHSSNTDMTGSACAADASCCNAGCPMI